MYMEEACLHDVDLDEEKDRSEIKTCCEDLFSDPP